MARPAPTLPWTLALHARHLVCSDDWQVSLLACSDEVRRHAGARHLLMLVYNLSGLWNQGAGFVRVWEFSRSVVSLSFFFFFIFLSLGLELLHYMTSYALSDLSIFSGYVLG